MSKRTFTLLAALVAAVVCGLACLIVLLTPAPTEPFYQGKRLTFWLDRLGSSFQKFTIKQSDGTTVWLSSPQEAEARTVLLHAGSNAVPTLLRLLGVQGPESQPHRKRNGRPHPGYKREALFGFQVLGPQAAGAVPELIKFYNQNLPPVSPAEAALVLGWIGPAAKAAIPSLLRGTVSTDAGVRLGALQALAKIHSEPGLVVPSLIKALALPDPLNGPRAQAMAAYALAAYGPDAKKAVPVLLELLGDPGVNKLAKDHFLDWFPERSNLDPDPPSPLFDAARTKTPPIDYALKKIDPGAAAQAGLK